MRDHLDNNAPSTPGLIVDFPPQPRAFRDMPRSRSNRRVTFHDTVCMTIIPQDKTPSKSYTPDDITGFKMRAALDVRRLREEFAAGPTDLADQEIILHSIGLERFLSPILQRLAVAAKRAHCDAILHEQSNQEQEGVRDESRLSRLSEVSSSWSRARAIRLANYSLLQLPS